MDGEDKSCNISKREERSGRNWKEAGKPSVVIERNMLLLHLFFAPLPSTKTKNQLEFGS